MADTPSTLDDPFIPPIVLDRTSPVPLYHQISQPLEELIVAGKITAGRLIEDEVSMAQRLHVSRPTTRRALQDLVSRGLLTRRRGIGTRVTPSHVRRPLALTSLNEDLQKAGFEPRTAVLAYEVRLANEVEASFLNREVGTEIVYIERKRSLDDRTLAIMHNYLPADIAPSLTQLTHTGLYACFREHNVIPASAQQTVGAKTADAQAAALMGIDVGAALLTMQRTAYDAQGAVIEYGDHIYDAELYSFHFTLTAD
ncbi:GntR family transcriptional regulator [Schaalia suimastitidis]|uniref:GntR family transcriptional regulator n=1 Tax=Schaalia suimastitidis TaxID=121163 RepID=UPI0004175D07|nr:GntR family transcriptional regulator [Schaalia suimastitidis]